MSITSTYYGRTQSGEDVYQYTLENENGLRVMVIEYGCVVTNLFVPDRTGTLRDVVLGYNCLEHYEQGTCFFGAFVGRYANRIENSAFTLDGRTYTLEPNDGRNHLHGTFAHRVFKGSVEDGRLVLRLHSPDGEEGYPGALEVTVTYDLTDENAFVLDYTASATAPTIVNFTNHSYFNLNGQDAPTARDNLLQLAASHFTEGNAETLPTGRILPVAGTAMDFTAEKPIGRDMAADEEQLHLAHGYDHNFVLDKVPGQLARAGAARSERTGIAMELFTTQPGVQLYTGNFLSACAVPGKGGVVYQDGQGFCLETQHYPCTPSHPEFPSVVLRPEDELHETTVYRFSVKK